MFGKRSCTRSRSWTLPLLSLSVSLGLTFSGTLLAAQSVQAAEPPRSLRMMAPAAPGGGWDSTTRQVAAVLKDEGIISGPIEVFNVPGAGGTIGLARLASSERGKGDLLMTMGLVMVGSILTNNSAVTLAQTTPIARLTAEFEVIVVPKDSKFKTLADLVKAFKENPKSISWAGGSAGGVDHILVGLLAKELGVNPKDINYIPYSGGGEALASILGGHVSAGVSGYGEWAGQIESGQLRALAISSSQRVPGINVPTFIEQGINLEIGNWRGIVAPPGISERDRAALIEVLDRMHRSNRWKQVLKDNNWNDYYLSGDAFKTFIERENVRVKQVLQEIGLIQ